MSNSPVVATQPRSRLWKIVKWVVLTVVILAISAAAVSIRQSAPGAMNAGFLSTGSPYKQGH